MGSFKKYDEESKQWKVLGSTDASEIFSRSNVLAEYVDTTEANIQNVLEKVVEDVNTAKGNISWLALHGGGGSGSGGGGGSTVATGTILVNGNIESGAQIIRKDTERLYFSIKQDITQSWNYTISFNGKLIKSGKITSGNITIADGAAPLEYVDGKGTLSITCTSGLSNIYWNGTIVNNQLVLSANVVSIDIEDLDSPSSLIYTYSGTQLGEYILTITNKWGYSINRVVSVDKINTSYNVSFSIAELGYTSNDIGSNTTTANITYKDDSTVSTTITHQIVILANKIVISSETLSKEIATTVPKNTTIPCVFTAYLSGKSIMQYRITLNGVNVLDNEWESGTLNNTIYKYISTSSADLLIGQTYKLVIYVKTAETGDEGAVSEEYDIYISESVGIALEIPKTESLLCDFKAFGGTWNSDIFGYVWEGSTKVRSIQSMELHNPNVLSGMILSQSDPAYYRISNKAYGVFSSFNIDGSEKTFQDILNAKKNFTVSLTFKADYHSEDDKTIFQLGTLDAENELQNGILINVHEIQVKGSSTCTIELQDNEVYTIDIVYNSTEDYVKIYVNGVVTKASKSLTGLNFNNCFPIIGCGYNSSTDEYINHSDCQFYRVMMYSAELNDFDILINRLQNESYTNYIDGAPNSDMIIEGLDRNFLELDPTTNKISKSWFWDTSSEDYSIGNFIETVIADTGATKTRISSQITEFNLPIPLLYLDLSSSSAWTWDNFITATKLETVHNTIFNYYDQKGTFVNPETNSSIIEGTCSISIQGTSTTNYAIKNLTFSLKPSENANPNMFIPKSNWMPEEEYTLKADVIDSSHSINAAVGKFINEVLANSEEDASNNWFPLRSETRDAFKASTYYKACPEKPTLKTAVEGFPFFLIMRFYNSNPNIIDVRSLGIYQFILGRGSVHNLGLKILNSVQDSSGESIIPESYPYYKDNITFKEADTDAYWVESKISTANAAEVKLDNPSYDLTKSEGLHGFGWQSTDSELNELFEVKYGPVNTPSEVPHFKKLLSCISKAPTYLYSYFDGVSTVNRTFERASYKELKYEGGKHIPTGATVDMYPDEDSLVEMSTYLDAQTAYRYLPIAMMFGLVDNFCKNQPFVLFDANNNSKYRLTFYDMDTGLGGDNNGNISVPSHVYIKGIENDTEGYVKESYTATNNNIITVADNKLWLSLEHGTTAFVLANLAKTINPYSYYWNSLRDFLYRRYSDRYETFADFFSKEYFLKQTEGCGELLFNLTYNAKYLNSTDISFLSGRRVQQTYQWLKEHVDFLDSISYWKPSGDLMLPSDNNNTTVNIVSFDNYQTIPLKYNRSLVIKTSNQGGVYNYPILCLKNTFTHAKYGGGLGLTAALSKTISWSKNLLEIGNEEATFGDSGFQKMDTSPLYGFNTLDLSNCKTLLGTKGTSPIDFESVFYDPIKGSELRVINLENATNTNEEPNIILNLGKFTKITDINIRNSNVGTINLPATPLLSLDITGSSVTNLKLEKQSLLDRVDVTGCSKLTELSIVSSENVKEISGLTGLANLKHVAVSNCNNESITIRNCVALTTVEINEESLKSLVIDNCPNLTSLSIAGSINITNLQVTNCKNLYSITFSPTANKTWADNLKSIDFYNTSIYKSVYGEDDRGILDLSEFTSIYNFSIHGNDRVEYIRFANNTYATPLTNRFDGCTNLVRIYGHIALTNTYNSQGRGLFQNCSRFTLHGNSFRGKSVVDDNGVFKMPYEIVSEITSKVREDIVDGDYWDNGEFATNADMSSSNTTYMFANTSLTQFDVYYIFSRPGNVTDFTYTFWGLSTRLFLWEEDCDNSPHRHMFMNCKNVNTLIDPFRGSCSTYRILSPTVTDGISDNNGLFSPLINLVTLQWIDCGTFIVDRNVFHINNSRLTSISYFVPSMIVDDTNEDVYINLGSSSAIQNYLLSKDSSGKYRLQTVGNLSNVFDKLARLTSLTGVFTNTYMINYDLSNNADGTSKLVIPISVTRIKSVCSSSYATGEIRINKLIPDGSNVVEIEQSFRVDNDITAISQGLFTNPTLTIAYDTFSKMPRLQRIGYGTGYSYSGSPSYTSFNGYITKTVEMNEDGSFPYSIFDNNPNLTHCVGLFQNAKCTAHSEIIELPGILFKKTPRLKECDYLFYDFQDDYMLSSRSFENCTGLTSVSYMFGQSYNSIVFHLIGQIPKELFYHGETISSKTLKGTNIEPIEDENGELIYDEPSEVTFTYRDVNANITNMSYCFQRCNPEPYENLEPSVENNVDYNPFKYLKNDKTNTWSEATINNYEKTYIWNYDGYNIPSGFSSYENRDEPHSNNLVRMNGSDSDSLDSTLQFMCAPDLLRYCKNNKDTNIKGLFAYSGVNLHTSTYEVGNYKFFGHGLKGRIPPYFLKPISLITDISYMFLQCKCLSAYLDTTESYTYKIPKTFFEYAPKITKLVGTFSGMHFNYNIDLNVFGSLNNLDISFMFNLPYFETTPTDRCNINGIFQGKTIANLDSVFAVVPNHSNPSTDQSGYRKDNYVTFSNVFTTDRVSSFKQSNGYYTDGFAFAGYSENTVVFGTKTLDTRVDKYNYATS